MVHIKTTVTPNFLKSFYYVKGRDLMKKPRGTKGGRATVVKKNAIPVAEKNKKGGLFYAKKVGSCLVIKRAKRP